MNNPFDGDYQAFQSIFNPDGKVENNPLILTIKSEPQEGKFLLLPGSTLGFASYSFELNGWIDGKTGLATLEGETQDFGVSLKEGACLFQRNGLVSGSFLFDGKAALGFYFFIGGFRKPQTI